MQRRIGVERQMRHSYRCFLCVRNGKKWQGKEQDFRCRNIFPWLDRVIPESFTWLKPDDVDGMHAYIDALLVNDTALIHTYETAGVILDLKYPEQVEERTVKVNINAFLNTIALRDSFDIPVGMRMHFCSAGHGAKLIARDYAAALAPFVPDLQLDQYDDWRLVHNATQLPRPAREITTSMNRPAVAAAAVPVYQTTGDSADANLDEAGVTAPAETEVGRRLHDRYADITTIVSPPGQKSYFAKRLIGYNGSLLWVGSAWHRYGPWRVTHRDASRMLALGVREP